jgi:hypothetical protein
MHEAQYELSWSGVFRAPRANASRRATVTLEVSPMFPSKKTAYIGRARGLC